MADQVHDRNVCYDLEKDFDESGNVKGNATPIIHAPLNVHKHINFDPETWKNIKIYLRQMKAKYQECKDGQRPNPALDGNRLRREGTEGNPGQER